MPDQLIHNLVMDKIRNDDLGWYRIEVDEIAIALDPFRPNLIKLMFTRANRKHIYELTKLIPSLKTKRYAPGDYDVVFNGKQVCKALDIQISRYNVIDQSVAHTSCPLYHQIRFSHIGWQRHVALIRELIRRWF